MNTWNCEAPQETAYCDLCGAPLNAAGECMEWRNHDDPYDSYRDE